MESIVDPIDFDDLRIAEFLQLWHERDRAAFERSYPSLDYDSAAYAKTASRRRKYIALDHGTSGKFLLDRGTGLIWGIKAYGVRHPGKLLGHIDQVIAAWVTGKAVA